MAGAAAGEGNPRPLGFGACLALVIGSMIGSGVFLIPAQLAPLGWKNASVAWVVTIAGTLCLARIFADLAARLPEAGGPYGHCRTAFGEAPAFVLLWSYWISVLVANAAIAVAAVSYLTSFAPALAALPGVPALLAVLLLWTFTGVNLLGAAIVGRVQIVTTILKLLPLAAAIVITLGVAAGFGRAAAPPIPPATLTGGGVTAAAALTLWAMLGFEGATMPDGKVDRPEVTVPRATMAGTVLAGLVYLVACSGVALLLPPAQAAASPAPFADFVRAYWGAGPATAVALFAAISCMGALNGWILVSGEVPLALARRGVFPRWFAQTGRGGTPVRAILVGTGFVTLLTLANFSRTTADLFVFMALLSTTTSLMLYVAVAAGAVVLMRRGVLPARRGLIATAAAGFAYGLWTLWGAGSEASGLGLLLLGTGLPAYLIVRRTAARAGRAQHLI